MTTKTIAAFIAEQGLTMANKPVASNPHIDSVWEADHWECSLAKGGRSMTIYYSQGMGHRRWNKEGGTLSEHDRKRYEYVLGGRVPYSLLSTKTLWAYGIIKRCTEPTPPTIDNVLDCLASDAQSTEGRTFEEWAGDMGVDTDSRKAEKSYQHARSQSNLLRRILGPVAMAELCESIERL